jgi:hypothetical protein
MIHRMMRREGKTKSRRRTVKAKPGAKGAAPAKSSKGGGMNVAGERPALPKGYVPRLADSLSRKRRPDSLKKTFGYTNPMELPRLTEDYVKRRLW